MSDTASFSSVTTHLVKAINGYCEARGEKSKGLWETPMLQKMLTCEWNQQESMVRNLEKILLRVERGEPLIVRGDQGLQANSQFTPAEIVTRELRSTKRDVPMCPPFLDPEIYSEERDGATFLPSRFEEIVNAIADKIVESEQISTSLPPKRRCREQTWRILMLDLGRQKVTKKGWLRPWIRTNLISIAERVRNWEFLYHPEDIFRYKHGFPIIKNEVPTNWLRVPAPLEVKSRSLGRISIRSARMRGITGEGDVDGGLVF